MKTSPQAKELLTFLSVDEIDSLLELSEIINFAANEIIIPQGHMLAGLYIISKGAAISKAKLIGEATAEIETFSAGSFLGEVSFIECIPSPKSIVATEETECIFIERSIVEHLDLFNPTLKYHLFNEIAKQICERLHKMYEIIAKFITNSDMVSQLTFIGKVIESLNKPEKISAEDIKLSPEEIYNLFSFHSFPLAEFNLLLKKATLYRVPKNYKLISPTKKSLAMYMVLFGAVQSTIEIDSKVAKLSVISPGKLFLSPAMIDTNIETAIAFTTCEKAIILHLSEESIADIKSNELKLWYKLFDLACHSLAALEKSVYKLDVRLSIETYNR